MNLHERAMRPEEEIVFKSESDQEKEHEHGKADLFEGLDFDGRRPPRSVQSVKARSHQQIGNA